MHMLSLFPQLLFLAPVSALLIRLALALLFALSSWRHVLSPSLSVRVFAFVEITLAALLATGAATQAVALLAGVVVLAGFAFPNYTIAPRTALLLALVMCVSLLLTGAGAFAFDLPL